MHGVPNMFIVFARLQLMALIFSAFVSADASAQPFCSAPNLVDVSFPNGTRWQFCWEMRQREGLVINRAFYTDRSGIEREVLFRASIAQIHVPYHPGSPRFRDVTVSTSGIGAGAVNISAAECNPGVLLSPQVCREVEGRGFAWKFGSASLKGQQVTVWMSTQLGQYNYLIEWTFRDDGEIVAEAGLTGRLQIVSAGEGYAPFGSRVNPEADPTPIYGINHMHSIFYRFDFDIGGSANDAVDGLYGYQHIGTPSPVTLCDTPGQCTKNDRYRLTVETPDLRYPGFWNNWQVVDNAIVNNDGRNIGYEIVPRTREHWDGMFSAGEHYLFGDIHVTAYDGCELLATDNRPPYIPASCEGAQPDVLSMTSEASPIDGQDLVVWYLAQYMHVTRDEDQVNMPTERVGVHLVPRNWRHVNTLQP